jgi:hypothetical protein
MSQAMFTENPTTKSVTVAGGTQYEVRNQIAVVHSDHVAALISLGFKRAQDVPSLSPNAAPEIGLEQLAAAVEAKPAPKAPVVEEASPSAPPLDDSKSAKRKF